MHVVTQLKQASMRNFTDLHIYCTQLNRFKCIFMYSSTGRELNHCQKTNNQYLYMWLYTYVLAFHINLEQGYL